MTLVGALPFVVVFLFGMSAGVLIGGRVQKYEDAKKAGEKV